ncbi:PEGA domain-containing protein [Spongiibacter marinus]|uniref:PEGA domain-containing protein n=1 Tax=Spongiibacter marinus TaxID=354246 RepID=UPI0013787F46|nr:PEGA domain-containing protein [Spongiibacter marinus]
MKRSLIALSLFFIASCATIISGTSQTLVFSSEPIGAQVLLDGRPVGVTPLTISVKKNSFDIVEFRKKGYKSQTLPMETSFDGVTLLSIFWDLGTTDVLSGAAWEYSPDQFHTILSADSDSYSDISNDYFAIKKLVLSFGDELRSQLILGAPGEELNALITLLSDNNHAADEGDLLRLAMTSEHDLAFSENIISFYQISKNNS